MDTDGNEIKRGIDASQANLTVAICIFSTPTVVATVSSFRPLVFHCYGRGRGGAYSTSFSSVTMAINRSWRKKMDEMRERESCAPKREREREREVRVR